MARKTNTTTRTAKTNTKSSTNTAKEIVKAANVEVEKQDDVIEQAEINDVEEAEDIEEVSAKNIVELINNTANQQDDTASHISFKSESANQLQQKQLEAVAQKPVQKTYDQHDLILCRNVSAGWLKMTGKSGIPYVWNATGDLCEVEYGDLWARKTAKSEYLYKPYFVIEDEELLEQPRWKDLKTFYDEKVYGLDNVDAIINVPSSSIRRVLVELSDGMKNAVAVRAATMIENGSLDSLKKIKIIDEVCGTDLMSVIPD